MQTEHKGDEMENLYWLWLASLTAIGNQRKLALLEYFKDPKEIYAADDRDLVEFGHLTEKDEAVLKSSRDLTTAERAAAYAEKHRIDFLPIQSEAYPAGLKKIYNPPVFLFARGDRSLFSRDIRIAIVGSRSATPGGLKLASQFGQELSEMGMTVVSGMAEGIDANSHWGALQAIGSTIAVLGSGADICYPKKNQSLYEALCGKGLLVSEFFLGEKPLPFHFPMRNRVISGLSDGVLVVEARKKSGALITAKHAVEQGKNVYAIPQDIHLVQSVGSNALLKDGAKVVTEAADILEDYAVKAKRRKRKAKAAKASLPSDLSPLEGELYGHCQNGVLNVDGLAQISGQDIQQINTALMMLELKDLIHVAYGQVSLL